MNQKQCDPIYNQKLGKKKITMYIFKKNIERMNC